MRSLPVDPDTAAAFVLADLTKPDVGYDPSRVTPDYRARLADAGVLIDDEGFSEQGFLLRRLTSRALILDTAWLQTIQGLANPRLDPKSRGAIVRAASKLQEDLDRTYALILRVRKAQGENEAPFLSAADQALADDSRAESLTLGAYGLSIPQIVRAEALGEAIYAAEFEQTTTPLDETEIG